MHRVDRVTEQMIRSVLAYAENRLRLDPVPLDKGSREPADLDSVLGGLLGEDGHDPDQVLGAYAATIAPAVISADSPRFLAFIPAAPTKAALLFDMLVSCASIQGISWLEAAGAVHAENQVLRFLADRAGLPASAGGCFVSGGSAADLSALAVARETASRKAAGRPRRRWRVLVSADAHSSTRAPSGCSGGRFRGQHRRAPSDRRPGSPFCTRTRPWTWLLPSSTGWRNREGRARTPDVSWVPGP